MLANMSASMWIKKACHADLYTVSRCCIRGESEDHTSEKACKKGSTLALKPRTDVTRSLKQGISDSMKRTYVLQKFLKKDRCDTALYMDTEK